MLVLVLHVLLEKPLVLLFQPLDLALQVTVFSLQVALEAGEQLKHRWTMSQTPHAPVIPLLGIYFQKEKKATCTKMVILVLSTSTGMTNTANAMAMAKPSAPAPSNQAATGHVWLLSTETQSV